jgi:hypothetical protein
VTRDIVVADKSNVYYFVAITIEHQDPITVEKK